MDFIRKHLLILSCHMLYFSNLNNTTHYLPNIHYVQYVVHTNIMQLYMIHYISHSTCIYIIVLLI